jgi:hypothetical protein
MSFFSMPLYILDICPENRDESNGNSIVKLWLQFIPIFGALHPQLRKGHTTKKDIPMLFCIEFLRRYNFLKVKLYGSLAFMEPLE